jgi:hypothetical protein
MAKLSKSAKNRVKRMSAKEKADAIKAATLLADHDLITHTRWSLIFNACKKDGPRY